MSLRDLSVLIIKGNPSQEELDNAWSCILEEYSELIQTDRSNNIHEVYKKICYLNFKRDYLQKALWILENDGYDEKIAERIMLMGYDHIQNLEDRGLYLAQIYSVEIESRNITVLLNQYKADYDRLCPSEEEYSSFQMVTEMDYEIELAALSKHFGFEIDKRKKTVFEVCGYINVLIKDTKSRSNAR